MKQAGWRLAVKCAVDRVVAASGLVLLSPVMVCVGLAIRATMGAPILFRQQRPGRHGTLFELLKFRTMAVGAGSDEQRLSRLGRFLRAWSLDELPQLWNVVEGSMSLVGPRPLLPQYLERYTAEQARRHEVLPGITGWAQINGRNALSWEEKFRLDVWYVDHWSLRLDARILLTTMARVVRRQGISSANHATMPEFQGNQRRS